MTQTWTLIVDVPDDLTPSDLQDRIQEEPGVTVVETHFERMIEEPDEPIESRELACRAFRDLVKRGQAGFDAYDPAMFLAGDVTVAGRTPAQIAEDLDDRLIYLDRNLVGGELGLVYRFRVVDGELGPFVTDDLRLKLADVGDYQIDTALASRAAR